MQSTYIPPLECVLHLGIIATVSQLPTIFKGSLGSPIEHVGLIYCNGAQNIFNETSNMVAHVKMKFQIDDFFSPI